MAASSHKNFRLRGIPREYETRGEVCSLIQKILALEPNASPTVYSLALSPTDRNSKIATLSFPSIPDCLSDRLKTEWNFNLSEGADIDFGRSLAFDTHFTGFTPFHRASDKDCHIDVIAVCGLGGHALGSFKEKNGRFVWLRDALPSDIPNARIFTYGYNSQLVDSQSFQSLTDLGRALQVDLEDIRDSDQSRSILFIGHSLGGLVIKETVRILKEEPLEPDSSVLGAISGFAFFGVPHRGLAVQCLVPLVKNNPNRALLESLNRNSSLLDRLQIEFDKISTARSFSAVSFYETEKSPTRALVNGKWEMSGSSEVLVEVVSATCGCPKQHPINRNHSEMVKYSGVHDQIYRRVIVSLRPILRITRGRPGTGTMGRGPQVFVRLSGDEQECLKSLSFPEQEHRYSEISYASDTCDWLLEDHNFQKWMNTARGLFWIKGCPGTGKSVLMKFAADTMNRRKSGDIIASFFIHGRGIPLQRTPLGIFRALLNSLLLSFPTYLDELTKRFQDRQQRHGSYEQNGGWRWNETELERFLASLLVKGTKDHPVVIFVDALDECGEEDAKRLLIYFKDIINDAERGESLLKICFSSRHFPILGHETMSNIYVEQRNDKDIRVVVQSRLKDIKPDGKRQKIENEISLKSHGGFQWAVLITNMIRDQDATGARTQDLLRIISSVPPGLDELYNFILKGASHDEYRQMTKLFQWVLFARRPLSAQELREALATDGDMTCTTVSQLRSQGNWSDSVLEFEKRVLYISRGLVEFQTRDVYEQYDPEGEEWSREAQFIHQSAADFVAQSFLTHNEENAIFQQPDDAGDYEMSRSFLKYLTLEEVLNGGNLSREKLSATFPLMPYGVAFLLGHIRAIEGRVSQLDLIMLMQWDRPERLQMLANIWRIMDPESTHAPRGWPFERATALHLAVALDSFTLLDSLLQKDVVDLVAQDDEGNTPLHLALREGYQDLALLLLERSRAWDTEQQAMPSKELSIERKDYMLHVNATNSEDESPLSLALSVKADQAIYSLIEAGAKVEHEKSLVFYAISVEDRTLMSRLIETGADLEGAVFFTIQCLNRANHHSDHILNGILADLLNAHAGTTRYAGIEIEDYHDADESDDEDAPLDEDAIFLASRNGSTTVINLLLSHRSSAMLQNRYGYFPLYYAVTNYHLETAIVLHRAAPQAVTFPHCGATLNEIIDNGWFRLVQIIVEEGDGELTWKDIFSKAIEINSLSFMRVLFDQPGQGIFKLATQNHDEYSAHVLLAASKGFVGMVELLFIASDIYINDIRNETGDTLLLLAVRADDVRMTRVLLGTGEVNVNDKNEEGQTPILWAIQNDNQEIMKDLLDTGDIDFDGLVIWGQTPLWWAIKQRRLAVTKLLLERKEIDVNQKDEEGQTPLWCALKVNNKELVKLLLATGRVDLHERNKEGLTPILWAMKYGWDNVVQLLLDCDGFAIDEEDEELGREAFWWALRKGKGAVVELVHKSHKFDINSKDEWGRTPLIWAVDSCEEAAVEVLLGTGKVDVHAVDDWGNTALSLAIQRGHGTMIEMLSRFAEWNTVMAMRFVEE